MAAIIDVTDLPTKLQSVEMIDVMVDGANAYATRVAPCLADASPDQLAEARLVLLGAVKRWAEAGAGAFTQQSSGPFQVSMDTRQRTGFNLWAPEIQSLQGICRGSDSQGQAFTIDTTPAWSDGYWTQPDTWEPLV
jgi:hypothetical protein